MAVSQQCDDFATIHHRPLPLCNGALYIHITLLTDATDKERGPTYDKFNWQSGTLMGSIMFCRHSGPCRVTVSVCKGVRNIGRSAVVSGQEAEVGGTARVLVGEERTIGWGQEFRMIGKGGITTHRKLG